MYNIGDEQFLDEGVPHSSRAPPTQDENFDTWHFTNGLFYQGDLDISLFFDMFGVDGLIIEGDVHVKGFFGQCEEYYPDGTLILGNVTCQSFIHENSHVLIDGNLEVAQTIFGYYNDGSLGINGNAVGEAWISYDHDMWAAGTYYLTQMFLTKGARLAASEIE